MIKLTNIKPNPKNPRLIKDERFKKLCQSIKDFPEMMKLRPMVIDDDGVILGGNMRFKALKELGYSEIPNEWVLRANELNEEQKQEFIIKDNVGFGENDWEALAEWDAELLDKWGLDLPEKFEPEFNEDEGDSELITKDKVICPDCGLEFTP